MIISEILEIKRVKNPSSEYVEDELAKKNIHAVRWAIVNVNDKILTVNVAYDKI